MHVSCIYTVDILDEHIIHAEIRTGSRSLTLVVLDAVDPSNLASQLARSGSPECCSTLGAQRGATALPCTPLGGWLMSWLIVASSGSYG